MKNNKRKNKRWEHKYRKALQNNNKKYLEGYNTGYEEACNKLLKLFDIHFSEQQLAYTSAGLEVNVEANIKYKTSELIEILKNIHQDNTERKSE